MTNSDPEPDPPTQAKGIVPDPAKTWIAHLDTLRQSLDIDVPYTCGVLPVADPHALYLYFKTDDEGNARFIDFGNAQEERLVELAAACQKATFGLDQTDVLDETYRKAGKLDLDQFSAQLDVVGSGLMDAIAPDILDGQDADADTALVAELYKLNVYGPGSFFKAHQDTPRAENMIGSLVVVFHTPHEGGELTLVHGDNTEKFDSAAQLAAQADSRAIAYVAFYSDVVHTVEPVSSGYRVTLTYSLFLAPRSGSARQTSLGRRIVPPPEERFEAALRALLADPTFLPTGGLLAYGLAHEYPLPRPRKEGIPSMLKLLKGSDARIRTVSTRVGLSSHVKVLYNSGEAYGEGGQDVIVNDVLNLTHLGDADEDWEESFRMEEIERMGVIITRDEVTVGEDTEYKPARGALEVHWVRKRNKLNSVESPTVFHLGNEAGIGYFYAHAALFVLIPAAGEGVRYVQ